MIYLSILSIKINILFLGEHCKMAAHHSCLSLKPIFHCNVKPFVLGTFVSPNAKDSTFVLPNARNTNMLVSLALGDAHFSRYLTQNPQHEPVEYRLRWVPNANFLHWPCTFHFCCVDFICVGWPTRTPFPVEYGLKFLLEWTNQEIVDLSEYEQFP